MLLVIDGSPKDPYEDCKVAPGIKTFLLLPLLSLLMDASERNLFAEDVDRRVILLDKPDAATGDAYRRSNVFATSLELEEIIAN